MKKILIVSLLFIPALSLAQGIVPCTIYDCTLCQFFVMLNNIYNFVLFTIIPPLAALILAIGGLMYIIGGTGRGGPDLISQAKKLFVSVIIGMFIAYGAWVLINLFLIALGYSDTWGVISCGTSGSLIPGLPGGTPQIPDYPSIPGSDIPDPDTPN